MSNAAKYSRQFGICTAGGWVPSTVDAMMSPLITFSCSVPPRTLTYHTPHLWAQSGLNLPVTLMEPRIGQGKAVFYDEFHNQAFKTKNFSISTIMKESGRGIRREGLRMS
jgi:hypothetical protein